MTDFGVDRRIKKSRKEHQCEECQRTIPLHSSYMRHTGVWDGQFYDFTSCLQCHDLRHLINTIDEYFYEGMFGGVGEWFAQGMIREVDVTFEKALQLERLRRAFNRRWVPA